MSPVPDPRPLPGEPLALDLLNTRWRGGDLFEQDQGLRTWLRLNQLDTPASEIVGRHLVEARAAVRAVLEDPSDRAAREDLNRVLAHGSVRASLGPKGRIERQVVVDDPDRRPAVLAAYNLVDLREAWPTRIRRCDHPECVLWFLDISRNGTRRWCSMETCGNRAKAQRHYARTHPGLSDQREGSSS